MNQNNQAVLQNQNINEPQSKSNLAEQSKLKKIKTKQTMSAEPLNDEDLVYERVKQSRFKQQNLPAWRPVPTILSIVIVFAIFGILFIILGIVLLIYSNKVKSAEIEYTDCTLGQICNKQLTLENDIDSPVFVYYQLNGFFQNSRRYVKSKETDQLTGDDISVHDECEPAEKNKEMGFSPSQTALDGSALDPEAYAVPCGLMAKTFFNDTFSFSIGSTDLTVDETNIAFDKDKKLYDENPDRSKQWMDMTNEHFLVWMRPSGLPNPKKLWGRIDRDLKQGEKIDIAINNNYDVSHYKGKKKIVLSNATKFGGKNKFLGISYIVVGALSILCAIIFPIGYRFQMQKEKDL
jgi:hypothetical protein